MKVLLVNGSPNKKGCTYTALSEVAKTLQEYDIETEIFWIKTKPIAGCIACGKCSELQQCAFDGDVVNEFVEKAYDVKLEDNTVLLEGVVSRKKQVVPIMTENA